MRVLTILVVLAAALAALFLLRSPRDTEPPEGPLAPLPTSSVEAGAIVEEGPLERRESPTVPETDGAPGPGPGRATARLVRGIVLDERDRAIPGAVVSLHALDPSTIRGAPIRAEETLATATTGSDGTFALPLETRRWARVVAAADGYGSVGLRVPGPGTRVRLVLPPAGALEVEVLEGDGSAAAGAEVAVVARQVRATATTGPDGRARFEHLPPGSVHVGVTADGLREGRSPAVTCVPGALTRVQVLLPAAVSLAGRIFERGSERPIPGAEIHLSRPGRAVVAGPARGDGTFGPVAAGAPGATVVVAVRAEGYAPALQATLVPDTEEIHVVDIALERAIAWTGRVRDGTGAPVAGARVGYTAAGIAGREPASTTTDEEGRFHLPPPSPPAPGRRVVLVAEHGGRMAALALRPGDEAPAGLVLVLERAAEVTGRVVDAEGEARGGVVVRLDPRWRDLRDTPTGDPHASRLRAMNERGRLGLMATTDAAGWWRLADVPDGTYDVQLVGPDGGTRHATTLTVSGTDVDLGVLRSGTGRTLAGRVVDESGRPLAGADVVGRDAEGRRVRATADGDGAWQLTDLPGDRWTLAATLPGRLPASRVVDLPASDPVHLVLGEGARLVGRVLDEGRPFAGPFTLHVDRDGSRRLRLRRTFRDAAGRFRIEGLGAGHWRIRVETARGRGAESPSRIEVRPGATFEVDLELTAGASVGGRLTTPAGTPVTDARVTLTHEESGRRRKATTGAGTWRADGLPAGTWRVTARGRGGAPVETTVDLPAGASVELDLELARTAKLDIAVVGKDGKARPRAYVTVRPGAGPSPAWRRVPRTDDDGRVVLPDAPTGLLDVVVRTPANETGRMQIHAEAGAEHTVVVTVLPAP